VAAFANACETGGPLHCKRRPPLQNGSSCHATGPLDSATLRHRFAFCGLLPVRAAAPTRHELDNTMAENKVRAQEENFRDSGK